MVFRVYIDQLYPDPNTRNYLRNKAAELITNVVNSFKSMVDQVLFDVTILFNMIMSMYGISIAISFILKVSFYIKT